MRHSPSALVGVIGLSFLLGASTCLSENPVLSHQSEYVVDESGGILIFRYKNKVVLNGPNRGAKDPCEKAYIFRVTTDKFYEVHGFLPIDDKKPGMTSWERLKVNPFQKPAT